MTGMDKPVIEKGFAKVPEKPGLGVDFNEEVIRQHLQPGTEYFAPTEQWNNERSGDRLWS